MNDMPQSKPTRERWVQRAIWLALAVGLTGSLFWVVLYAWITIVTLD